MDQIPSGNDNTTQNALKTIESKDKREIVTRTYTQQVTKTRAHT